MNHNEVYHVSRAECRRCINPYYFLEFPEVELEDWNCGLCLECCTESEENFEAMLEELGL